MTAMPRRSLHPIRRRIKLIALFIGVLALSACIFLPDFAGQRKAGKYEPVDLDQDPRPRATAGPARPEQQTEPHTCGWHAMRSLYTAYGLDPDDFGLRFRLGTDQPAMRADKDSTGTLHPDLYRVLAQDGFVAEVFDFDRALPADHLDLHLSNNQLALAVVYRSTYHWVLLTPGDKPGRVRVIDSLIAEPVDTDAAAFVDEALSITLVRPAKPGETVSTADAHAAGLTEMRRLYQRK